MSRLSRVVIPGCAHHVTQRGVRSQPVFSDDTDRQLYLRLLIEEGGKHGLKFLAWCLMANHVHFIVVPASCRSLANAFGEAHRKYTWRVNRREGVQGYLFQGRFFSCPLDELHGLAAIRYVERNPVRAGVVEQAWEYPWSSAGFHVGVRTHDPLVAKCDIIGTAGEWREWLRTDPEVLTVLRKTTRTGRPCGDEAFVRRVEWMTGMDLRDKRMGRPFGNKSGHNTLE